MFTSFVMCVCPPSSRKGGLAGDEVNRRPRSRVLRHLVYLLSTLGLFLAFSPASVNQIRVVLSEFRVFNLYTELVYLLCVYHGVKSRR